MNLISILILSLILAGFVLALIYIVRHRKITKGCDGCDSCGACNGCGRQI